MKAKRIVPFMVFIMVLSIQNAFCQNETLKVLKAEDVEQLAEFPGGRDSLNSFLRKNVQYPRRSIMNGEKGRVFVFCTIDTEGTISEVELSHTEKLKRGSLPGKIETTGDTIRRPLLEAEAIRVVKLFPKFMPAKNDKGKPVNVRMKFPITFWVGGL